MIKKLFLIPAFAFMFACSGGTTQTNESQAELQEQIETLELANEHLEQVIISYEEEIDALQNEIDELLN